MAEPKQYINGLFITEKQFNDGGTILKIGIPADKLPAVFEQLKAMVDNGWIRLVIERRREPLVSKTTGNVTATHNIRQDTWKPKQAQAQVSQPAESDAPPF